MSRLPTRGSLLRWLLEPEPPGLGLDLRAGKVALARLDAKKREPELDLATTAELPPGLVELSMLEPNVKDEDGFAKILENLFLRAGVANAERIALTLPDYVAQLSILEVGEPPSSRDEIAELLRFRLKKSLPFDAGRARLAFERLPGRTAFLTGVMHEDVVSQYERLLERFRLHVGLVVPVSVSLLALVRPVALRELAPGADYFLVDVERDYFSVALVRDQKTPVLIRTLGRRANGGEDYSEDDLLQEIIPTAIYYREKLGGSSLERVYYRSLRPELLHLRELLEEQFEAPTEPFNLKKSVAISKELALDAALADEVGAAVGAAVGAGTYAGKGA